MNANQILTIFVISLLITLSSCNALKKQIDPNREKIGKEGEDYTLSYYKLKEGYCGLLKINVTELGKPLSKKDFMIITINGVGNSERGVEPLFYLDAGKKVILVRREVEVVEGSKFVRTSPSRSPKFDYTIKFDHPVIGEQRYVFDFSKSSFIKNIARARTFGFLKDLQRLQAQNLALGASLDNAVAIDDTHILNPEGLRFENEFVRHKILDAIGDLSLLGAPLLGDYTAFAGSHDLNHKLTLALMADEKNYEIATLNGELLKEYQKVFA